jgi:hypothetical protein
MATPTVAYTLSIAPPSQYLASHDVAKGSLFGQRPDPLLPQKIFMEYTIINTIYENDNDYDGLQGAANYLYTMLSKYSFKAASIVTGDGGEVAPVTPDATPEPYDFEVSGSSFIATGASTKVITAFIGYNVMFVRGGIVQSIVNIGGSYFTWDRDTGDFFCSPEAFAGELFQIIPV